MKPIDLKRSFSVGTWNIIGLKRKIVDVENVLVKEVDICAFQETKIDKQEDPEDIQTNYMFHLHKRENQNYGLGFAIDKNLAVVKFEKICDRISVITVRKNKVLQ